MRHIRDYFTKLGRNPTDVELETLAQTWSEQCIHKTFKSKIKLGQLTVDNLLKGTVMRVTEELGKPWCISVFRDNAGVIDFDGHYAVCFKVETHNHPSAVEPYQGAATGVGGLERTIVVLMSGMPVAVSLLVLSERYDFHPDTIPSLVLLSSCGSALTLNAWVWVLA